MSLFRKEILVEPQIVGATNGLNAPAGQVGEILFTTVAVGSGVSLTTATPANVVTLALTAGDWDVAANLNFAGTSTTVAAGALWQASVSLTSATQNTTGIEVNVTAGPLTTTSFKTTATVTPRRINVAANTTVYLVGTGTFTAGSAVGYGLLTARRVR